MNRISRKPAFFAACSIALYLLALLTLFFKFNDMSKEKSQTILPNDKQINAERNSKTQGMIQKAEKLIGKKMAEAMIPGLSITVVMDNKTVYMSGFGYADISSNRKAVSDTLFEIGSNSKAFTALGVLQLQKDGKIDLGDNISKYIPWLEFYYKGKRVNVTIDKFLHHTSGVPTGTIDRIPALAEEDKDAIEKTVKTIADLNLSYKPGEKYEYATINYDVLGLLIKYVSGINYEDYIQKYVLDTSGLHNTYMYRSKLDKSKMASGYKVGFFSPQYYDAPKYEGNKPAGYIISNANDMAEWLKLQMGTSTISQLDIKLIQESHIPDLSVKSIENDMSYASGWIVYNNGGREVIHSGSNPNYSSYIVFRPEDKIGVAVLCNAKSYRTSEIGQAVMDIFAENKNETPNFPDLNQFIDKICVIIISAALIILCFASYPFFSLICGIAEKKYKFQLYKRKNIIKFIILSIFFILFNFAIFSLSHFAFNRAAWSYIFVWYPVTVKVALFSIYLCIWVLYIISTLKNGLNMPLDDA